MRKKPTENADGTSIEPEIGSCLRDFMYGASNYEGHDYDPGRPECACFKTKLRAIQRTGRNHGLCEGETLLLINWLYRRGMKWDTIPYGDMFSVQDFVGNNANRIGEALDLSRGGTTVYPAAAPVQHGEPRTEW